jgi:hypothetical protein
VGERTLHPTGRRSGAPRAGAGVRSLGRRVIPAIAVAALTGCAAITGAARAYYASTPAYTEQRDWSLRRALTVGRFDSALSRVSDRDEDAPRDRLLRSLYHGLVAFYAGDYSRSGASLRAADELAEDRYTKSISRNALSLVSNDRVLPYIPGHNERLLVHYYAALGYIRRNDLEGAAVEARRLSALLQQFDGTRDSADISTRALLRYFAGAVFEAAGEQNDADVAYRNARALVPATALPRTATVRAGDGEIVVLVERGFVAHRVEETLILQLGGTERDRWSKHAEDEDVTATTSLGHFLRALDAAEDRGVYRTGSRHLHRDRTLDSVEYVLKVAWPVFLRPVRQAQPATLVAGAGETASVTLVGDISEGIIADYRRARTAILARAIARAVVKYIAAEQAEKKKGETGKVIANLAGALLEHADTRSWHLLPADISVARLVLPAGRHRVTLRLDPASPGDSARTLDLGEVDVRPGGVSVVATRVWPNLAYYSAR